MPAWNDIADAIRERRAAHGRARLTPGGRHGPATAHHDVGHRARRGVRPGRRRASRRVSLHPGPVRLDVPLEALDDAAVRRASAPPRTPTSGSGRCSRPAASGLSTAFDMPTLLGRDSDHELAVGEVGRAGVAIDTLVDMELTCSPASTSARSRTSMTINSAAPTLLAMYVALGDQQGVDRGAPRRHDPERHPEGVPGAEGVRLPAAAVDAAGHRRRCASPPPSCPGGTRSRSPATTSARPARRPRRSWRSRSPTGSPTWSRRCAAGLDGRRVRAAAVASSSTRTSTSSRRSPSTAPRAASGRAGCATRTARSDERSLQLRFHTQTAGVSLTAQQPEVNIARVAIEALAGGARRHAEPAHRLDSTKRWRCRPRRRRASRCAPSRSSPTRRASPTSPTRSAGRGTSRSSPTSSNARPRRSFAYLDELGDGSMLDGVDRTASRTAGSRREIADAAYDFQRRVNTGEFVIVGVNDYVDGRRRRDPHVEHRSRGGRSPARPTAPGEDRSRRRLACDADARRVTADAADPTVNLMPAILDAVRATRRWARSPPRWRPCSAAGHADVPSHDLQ